MCIKINDQAFDLDKAYAEYEEFMLKQQKKLVLLDELREIFIRPPEEILNAFLHCVNESFF